MTVKFDILTGRIVFHQSLVYYYNTHFKFILLSGFSFIEHLVTTLILELLKE